MQRWWAEHNFCSSEMVVREKARDLGERHLLSALRDRTNTIKIGGAHTKVCSLYDCWWRYPSLEMAYSNRKFGRKWCCMQNRRSVRQEESDHRFGGTVPYKVSIKWQNVFFPRIHGRARAAVWTGVTTVFIFLKLWMNFWQILKINHSLSLSGCPALWSALGQYVTLWSENYSSLPENERLSTTIRWVRDLVWSLRLFYAKN